MKRLSLIFPVLAALAIGACSRAPEDPDTLEVALVKPTATYNAGSVFVRVASNQEWTLALEPEVDWATLSNHSGIGSKNSVILDFQANDDPDLRSVSVVALSRDGRLKASATLTQDGYSAEAPIVPTNDKDGKARPRRSTGWNSRRRSKATPTTSSGTTSAWVPTPSATSPTTGTTATSWRSGWLTR